MTNSCGCNYCTTVSTAVHLLYSCQHCCTSTVQLSALLHIYCTAVSTAAHLLYSCQHCCTSTAQLSAWQYIYCTAVSTAVHLLYNCQHCSTPTQHKFNRNNAYTIHGEKMFVNNFKANTYSFTVEAEIKKLKQNITITSYIFTNSFKDSLISQ